MKEDIHMKCKKYTLNLRLFDGEGGAPATASTGEATGNETQTQTSNIPKSKKGALADVKYGIQEDATPVKAETDSDALNQETTVPDLEARKAEFEAMINGDYKDFFTERTQEIINKRFKETKTLQSELERTKPILEMLSGKYGAQDIDTLTKAIQEDESYYQDEAMEKGLTVEQLKEYKRLERENAEFRRTVEKAEADQHTNEIMSKWMEESEKMQEIYPSFDFDTEIDNPDFAKLLRAGVSIKAAFQSVHMDDIVGGAMYQAAQKTKEKVVQGIQSRNARPIENGLSSQSGVIVKNDVSKLTPQDRATIAKRVARGENIKF